MKKVTRLIAMVTLFTVAAIATFTGCSNKNQEEKIKSMQAELDKYKADEALQEKRLAIFDTLDYDFYSNQKWDMFNHSHADNIKVYYPDGSVTTGLYPQHIDQLTPPFLATTALDQRGFRPVLVLAHGRLLSAGRRSGTNPGLAGLAAADQANQTKQPEDAPRE